MLFQKIWFESSFESCPQSYLNMWVQINLWNLHELNEYIKQTYYLKSISIIRALSICWKFLLTLEHNTRTRSIKRKTPTFNLNCVLIWTFTLLNCLRKVAISRWIVDFPFCSKKKSIKWNHRIIHLMWDETNKFENLFERVDPVISLIDFSAAFFKLWMQLIRDWMRSMLWLHTFIQVDDVIISLHHRVWRKHSANKAFTLYAIGGGRLYIVNAVWMTVPFSLAQFLCKVAAIVQ